MTKFTVNGVEHDVDVEGEMPLLWVLRDELKVHGPKYGCGVAQCGACTVHMNGEAVKSCQVPAEFLEGSEITTIEGLGTPEALHAVQAAWIEHQVAQCGYCQSGQIMAAAAFLSNWKDGYLDRLGENVSQIVEDYNATPDANYLKNNEQKFLDEFGLTVTFHDNQNLPTRLIYAWDELEKKSLEAALFERLDEPHWFDGTRYPNHLDIRVKIRGGVLSFIAAKRADEGLLSNDEIDDVMSSNLCRCGTYPRIRAAVKTAARKLGGA